MIDHYQQLISFYICVPAKNSEFFTIRVHHMLGYDHSTLVGFVDFCCKDKISFVEILNMAKQLRIDVEGCTLWWLDLKSSHGLVEIKTDLDVLSMASSIDFTRLIYIYILRGVNQKIIMLWTALLDLVVSQMSRVLSRK